MSNRQLTIEDIDRNSIREQAENEYDRYGIRLGKHVTLPDGKTAHFVGVYDTEWEDDYGNIRDCWDVLSDECYWATVIDGTIYAAADLTDLPDEYENAGVR
jgi:hypothetical protein